MSSKKKSAAKRVTNWAKLEAVLAAGDAVQVKAKAEEKKTRDYVRAGMHRYDGRDVGAIVEGNTTALVGIPSELARQKAMAAGLPTPKSAVPYTPAAPISGFPAIVPTVVTPFDPNAPGKNQILRTTKGVPGSSK